MDSLINYPDIFCDMLDNIGSKEIRVDRDLFYTTLKQ